jgi:3-dehydroquinate synthase
VVVDESLAEHPITKSLSGAILTSPAGESAKNGATYLNLLERLAAAGADRKTTVVAVGGGVIGDLVGFAAATYMRGVDLVQVPTTLLAMVDSAVGGKVGIDLAAGKNLAGAVWPPQAVWLVHEWLETLPAAEYRSGMAEVLKYAFISDAAFADRLRTRPGIATREDILRCLEIKAQVVSEDEFETNGRRAILNFGHTIGHALEQVTGYATYRHGEAISVGMVAEARLGERLGFTSPGTAEIIRADLAGAGLPVEMPRIDVEALIHVMRRDKKASAGKLAFSLVSQIGACTLLPDVPESAVREIVGQ